MIIARFQKSFIDQSYLLGDEGGLFDQLCYSLASLVYAVTLKDNDPEYLAIAQALDMEADLVLRGKVSSPELQHVWANIGNTLMAPSSKLFDDLIADIEVSDIPLDPRFIDRFI